MNQDLPASNGPDDASMTAGVLFTELYGELHRIARRHMSVERIDHTLQTTALINEAYMSLAGRESDEPSYKDLEHFLSVAAIAMRRILINHAKAKKTQKRTAPDEQFLPVGVTECFQQRSIDLIALDDALQRLASIDATQAKIVELRFFGGMTVIQAAKTLGVSERTVQYEWMHAKAWLRHQLQDG